MGKLPREVNLIDPLDIDKIPIRRDEFFSNAYIIELQLDSQPGYAWQTIFEKEWKTSLHLWERKVVIVGSKLLLITTPTEIGEKIDWLKNVISSTNARLRQMNHDRKIIAEEEESKELKKHENIIRDTLRTKLSVV